MDEQILSLVRRFREGDEASFDDLAERLGKQAYRLAAGSVGDPNAAEDIVQDALLRLYMRGREIQDVRGFPSWFYRVVLNLIHDHYRRAAREQDAMAGMEEIRKAQRKAQEEPMGEEDRLKLRQALRAALGSLDEKHREAFLLKEVEGRSHADIAELLGIPEGTVWSRLSYARRQLREKLQRSGKAE